MLSALIVDDHEENAYLLRTLLVSQGYQVAGAANGEEALARARAVAPDIVISDILMPVMDGFTLCREWRRDPKLARIPFVFYTATYTDPKDEQLALAAGADLFLTKPTEPEAFLEAIAEVLRRQREGSLVVTATEPAPEATYLRQYSETLVRKLEDKLAQLEKANRALLARTAVIDASLSGVALADPNGRCTYVNPSLARVWGEAEERLEGRPLRELIGDEAVRLAVDKALAESGSWIGQFRTRRRDGTALTLHGLFEKVKARNGTPLCLMLSCVDVTDRNRMQEELQRTQRLESLSVFSRSIAHDFNNLLMGMLGNIELGIRVLPKDSPALRHFEVALNVHERARNLTQRLQAFAKGGPAERKRVDLRELLRECASLSLSGSNLRLAFSADDDVWAVEADPNQLSQLFNNLLINARQAMEGGGTLYVSIANRASTGERGGTLRPGRYVEVRIRDEGPGIPEEIAPRIFDPFFSTKPGGSGLGLATCHWIVKDHGGTIRLASPPGRGAAFVVLLPAAVGQPSAVPRPTERELAGQGRILLMDDEPVVRETAQRMLLLAGYDVVTATDGGEALAAYEQATEESRPFDLVLLDLTVRGGESGLQTLKRLRACDPESVVILSSGYHDEGMVARARALGCATFIQKPYLGYELLSRVKAAIGDG